MEDVDKIIFESFVKLKCTFCNEIKQVQNLNDLTASNVIEGVVKFLWACDPSTKTKISSYQLPEHTIARFRLATMISEALQSIGITEKFGFETFLYHNIFDVRRLFLILINKLPEEPMFLEVNLSPIDQIKLDVRKAIEKDLNNIYVPDFCRYLKLKFDGKYWHPAENQPYTVSFQSSNFFFKNKYNNRQLICSIITKLESPDTQDFEQLILEAKKFNNKLETTNQTKPTVPQKPLLLENSTLNIKKNNSENILPNNEFLSSALLPSKSVEKEEEEEEEEKILKLLKEKSLELEKKKQKLIELQYAEAFYKNDLMKSTQLQDKNDVRLLQLLKNPEENLQKLKSIIKETDEKRIKLQKVFNEIYEEKINELTSLKENYGIKKNSPNKNLKIKHLQQNIEYYEKLIEERTKIKKKLEKELIKVSKQSVFNDRSKYIKRVLEITANVNKQNEEILSTANLVKKLENELKSINDHLNRTFIVVENWLGACCESDSKMQKAYQLLIKMHEQCKLIISAINERGILVKNIDELSNQIENQSPLDFQLEKILKDLSEIKQENEELEKQINLLNLQK